MVDPLAPSLPLLLVMAGVSLSILEAVAPGAHFVVLGTALVVAGLAGLLFPPLGDPLALAALVLLVGGVALWSYRNLDIYGGSGTPQTSDSQTLSGRRGVVVQRVTQTDGRVRLYDGGFDPTFTARAQNEPIPEDTEIMVVDPGGGSVLTVAAVDAADEDASDKEVPSEQPEGSTSNSSTGDQTSGPAETEATDETKTASDADDQADNER